MVSTEIPAVQRLYERWVELAPALCENIDLVDAWTKESTDLIVSAFSHLEAKKVLDIGCGAGDPTLSLTTLVGEKGEIVGLDFVSQFIEELEKRASNRNIKNLSGKLGNSLDLPFNNESFDAACCRFGMQYLADDLKIRQLQEAYRVLKKGGEIVVVDWGEEAHGEIKNVYLDVLTKYTETKNVDKASTDFNLITAFDFARLLESVGFSNLQWDYAKIHWRWQGTPVTFWNFIRSMSPQMDAIFANIPEETANQIHEEIHQNVAKYYDGYFVSIPAKNIVVKGVK